MNLTTGRAAFAARMNEICSDRGLPAERGRQSALAKAFGVTPNAARKWLLGDGYPEMEVAVRLAEWADVNIEWLLTGRGPKRAAGGVPTKSLVLGEAVEALPMTERQQVLDFLGYKIERTGAVFTREKLARYMAMLDQFAKTPRGGN